MAYATAAGYANLPSGNFVPVIYSQKVLKYFRRSSVAEAITNTDYSGEIENFGDTVNIIKDLRILAVPQLTRKIWQMTKSSLLWIRATILLLR